MEQIKTGTTTVGIVCKDGIVLAADKRTTAGGAFVVRKESDKITQIADNMAVTTAGTVSDIQMFLKLLKAELKLRSMRNGRSNTVKETVSFAGRIMYDNARQYFPSMAHSLLGGYDATGPRLFTIEVDGCVLELKDYFATGSGSPMSFGVLENNYKDGLSVKEGEELAYRAVLAAIQRDPASGNGIDVYTVTKDGVKKTMQKKVSNAMI
ncbi:MAG TPA: proteasome subunit beta [Alphaproteobacteria bacterium]|nr:proteasome subunit beta [Alphaproteobacteria bacterium]